MKKAKRTPRDRVREARYAVYRQHVMEAAEEVFSERGFADASMQEIGRRAGVSMGTIYSVFRSKEEVLQAILEQRGGEILELVRNVASRQGPATEALLELLREYVKFFSMHPAFLRMHLRLGAPWIHSPEDQAGRRAATWEEIQRLQASILKRAMEEGEVVEADPMLLARLLSAVNQTLLAHWVSDGMTRPTNALLTEVEHWVRRLLWKSRAEATPGAQRLTARPTGSTGSPAPREL
jgi:AcrR family transcriptional regulator